MPTNDHTFIRFLDGWMVQRPSPTPLLITPTVLVLIHFSPLHPINLVLDLHPHLPLHKLHTKWMLGAWAKSITSYTLTIHPTTHTQNMGYTLRSSSEVGLLVGSLVRQFSMKLTKRGDLCRQQAIYRGKWEGHQVGGAGTQSLTISLAV